MWHAAVDEEVVWLLCSATQATAAMHLGWLLCSATQAAPAMHLGCIVDESGGATWKVADLGFGGGIVSVARCR